jgi:ribonuclease T1
VIKKERAWPMPKTDSKTATKLPTLIILVMLGTIALAWWQHNHAAQPGTPVDPSHVVVLPEAGSPTLPELAEDEEQTNVVPDEAKNDKKGPNVSPSDAPKPIQSLRPTNRDRRIDQKTNPDIAPDRPRTPGPLSPMRTNPSVNLPKKGNGQVGPDSNRPSDSTRPSEKTEKSPYLVENQTIRDLNGRVVFKGTIDLQPTLDRIERGEENRHRNDGSSFQNRENRLPRKPLGYYKEYVHPTKGEYGPGPQRIIIGKEGEVWYTPDHYKSFKKIK